MPTCHSTNDLADELIVKGQVEPGMVVITDNQTHGKGQRGNTWQSLPEMNLTFSLILEPNFLKIDQQFYLNIISSLAIYDLVAEHNNVKIKWPNDVYVAGKKLSGILVKNSLAGKNIEHAVVGIGLNVNQTSFDSAVAISLTEIGGKHYHLQAVLEKLLLAFESYYFLASDGRFEKLHKDYESKLYRSGENHQFFDVIEGKEFEGIITGIDPNGLLKIKTSTALKLFNFKEVQFLP